MTALPIALLAVIAFCAARRGLLIALDVWTERRDRPVRTSRLTVAALKKSLAALHTGDARVRLLRSVLRGRPHALVELDDVMRGELRAFVDAVETHASIVAQLGDDELVRFIRRRLPLPSTYVQACVSAEQRWSLVHCRTAESVIDLAAMIDVLTELLERSERKPQEERPSVTSGAPTPSSTPR